MENVIEQIAQAVDVVDNKLEEAAQAVEGWVHRTFGAPDPVQPTLPDPTPVRNTSEDSQ